MFLERKNVSRGHMQFSNLLGWLLGLWADGILFYVMGIGMGRVSIFNVVR